MLGVKFCLISSSLHTSLYSIRAISSVANRPLWPIAYVTKSTTIHILRNRHMFSKFVYNVPLPNCDAMTVSQAMFDLFCQFGVCSTIISDKGSDGVRSVKDSVSSCKSGIT
jgi:hypothetical protein